MDDPQEYPHVPHCVVGGFITIAPGDTLWSLARRYGTTVQAIIAANPGINLDVLNVGQLVCIPTTPGRPFPERCGNGTPYTVQPGDTFYGIARRNNLSLDALLAANPGVNPDRLQVGQIICLPTGGAGSCAGGTMYRVQPGDSLYAIGHRFNVDVARILQANPGLSISSIIYPGQMICIPVRGI